jgi:flagellin
MSISILNNTASLAAENQLNITNTSLQKTLEQLSSGSRINSGADDAAGLAVANGLMANITALTQSARNASDGVGKLQVADGALAQVTTLLNRAVTLATEAANGTLSDAERAPLQAEFASIQAEINRIGSTTNFNGQQVFQNVNANTEIGSATGVNASTSLGGAPLTSIAGTGVAAGNALAAGTAATWVSTSAALTQGTSLAGETVNITVTNHGTGTAASYQWVAGTTTPGSTVADLMGYLNGLKGVSASGANTSALTISGNGTAVSLSESGGSGIGAGAQGVAGVAATFTIGTANPFTYTTYGMGTVSDLVSAINSDQRYTAKVDTGNANKLTIGYNNVTEPAGAGSRPAIAEGGGGAAWSFGTAAAFTQGGGTTSFTIQPLGAATATTFYDQGNLTVGALMSDLQSMGLSATLNGNGSLVIADPNNPNNAPTITTPAGATTVFGNFAAGSSQASVASATDIYLTDDTANAANTIAVTIGSLSASNLNGASIASDNLSTQANAQAALTDISSAINDVASLRGTLGASVNRLQSATNVINNDTQNLTSAEDQIMAADIPSTAAHLSQYAILEQTGVAALAQSNQMQQLVLKLLQ